MKTLGFTLGVHVGDGWGVGVVANMDDKLGKKEQARL